MSGCPTTHGWSGIPVEEQIKVVSNPKASQVSDLPEELSQPARRALSDAGIMRLAQVSHMQASEVAKLHGMGPKGIEILRRALRAKGLKFAPETKKK
jgi:hypothetical protein